MNDNEAIQLLENAAEEIQSLKAYGAFSKEHIRWVSDTLYLLEDIFGRNSRIFTTFAHLQWQFKGSFVTTADEADQERARRNYQVYIQDLEVAQGLFQSGINLIKRKGLNDIFEGKDTPKEASEIMRIVSIVENSLRKAIRNEPAKERDVQDALEVLFIGAGLEFTREKEHVIFSSKTYIPDFVFKKIETIVEVKFCKKADDEKILIAQINDDIVAYRTKYPNLIFVIYDVGIIRNIDEFKEGFEKQDSVIVKVVKH